MPPVADLQHPFIGNDRTTVAVQARGFGERRQHVQLRQRGGGLLDFWQLAEHILAHALEQFVFQLHAAFLRAEDFAFHLLQFRRDVAFAVGDGLLADVMRRDLVEIRLRDFDVIAENGIEPDFQRRDAGAPDFVRLQFRNPVLAAALGRAEFVERGIEAVADHAAFLDRQRRVIHDGARNQLHEVGRFGELGFEFAKQVGCCASVGRPSFSLSLRWTG